MRSMVISAWILIEVWISISYLPPRGRCSLVLSLLDAQMSRVHVKDCATTRSQHPVGDSLQEGSNQLHKACCAGNRVLLKDRAAEG